MSMLFLTSSAIATSSIIASAAAGVARAAASTGAINNTDPYAASECQDWEQMCPGENSFWDAYDTDPSPFPAGNNKGCLGSVMMPRWFFFKIKADGGVDGAGSGNIKFELSAPEDVDYAVYGPFDDYDELRTECGSYTASPVSCSYSSSPEEIFTVQNFVGGKFYALLVSSFAQAQQQFVLKQLEGTTAIDCAPAGHNAPDPTEEPTALPTVEPTALPTVEPTAEPNTTVIRGVIRLTGNEWGTILQNTTKTAELNATLDTELTEDTGFPVTITSLELGSLIVGFDVETPMAAETQLRENLQPILEGRKILDSTENFYKTETGASDMTVSGISTESVPLTTPAPPNVEVTTTTTEYSSAEIAVPVGIGLVALVGLLICGLVLLTKRQRQGQAAASGGGPAGRSNNEPYAGPGHV